VDKLKLDCQLFPSLCSTILPMTINSSTPPSAPHRFSQGLHLRAEAKLKSLAVHLFLRIRQLLLPVGSVYLPVTEASSGQRCQQRPDQHRGRLWDSQDQVTPCTLASATNWSTACGLRRGQYGPDSPRNLTAPNQTRSPTPSHNTDQAVVNRVNFAPIASNRTVTRRIDRHRSLEKGHAGLSPGCQHRKPEQPPQRIDSAGCSRATPSLHRGAISVTVPNHVLEHQISAEWTADRVVPRKTHS